MKLFDWACKEGERDSCYFAGGHYITKGAIDRNPKKAVEYFTKSCESNHAPSCFNLAVMYNKGDDGVEIDQQMFEKYKDKTNNLVRQYGGLKSTKTA